MLASARVSARGFVHASGVWDVWRLSSPRCRTNRFQSCCPASHGSVINGKQYCTELCKQVAITSGCGARSFPTPSLFTGKHARRNDFSARRVQPDRHKRLFDNNNYHVSVTAQIRPAYRFMLLGLSPRLDFRLNCQDRHCCRNSGGQARSTVSPQAATARKQFPYMICQNGTAAAGAVLHDVHGTGARWTDLQRSALTRTRMCTAQDCLNQYRQERPDMAMPGERTIRCGYRARVSASARQ